MKIERTFETISDESTSDVYNLFMRHTVYSNCPQPKSEIIPKVNTK